MISATGALAVLAERMGIPVLPIFFGGLGYEGLLTIGRCLRVLPRKRFYDDIAARSFPYQPWWLAETNPYAAITEPA
ncbi:MAG: hypothetical protein MZV49_08165 [Rhodopseudomonas palustris]|nr:hypothetical protein [Rhodopseudomonas palustris]